MRHTMENIETLAQIRWLIVVLVGFGAFASVGGLVQTVSGIMFLAFLGGMLAGGLMSYTVYTLTEAHARNPELLQSP